MLQDLARANKKAKPGNCKEKICSKYYGKIILSWLWQRCKSVQQPVKRVSCNGKEKREKFPKAGFFSNLLEDFQNKIDKSYEKGKLYYRQSIGKQVYCINHQEP